MYMRQFVRILFCWLLMGVMTASSQVRVRKGPGGKLSPMGQLAVDQRKQSGRITTLEFEPGEVGDDCAEGNRPCLPTTPTVGAGGTQAEVSIAVDSTGQHIVLGFNDTRGFAKNPLSVSGFMYSDDGGRTFTDGGQLPSPANQVVDGAVYPQIWGDPDVKYLGACNFIYASLLVKVSGGGLVQTLGIHRSADCGHTWTGPIEVTPASNPNGQVDVNGDAQDAADKELMDVDPDTGRVMLGWSNFSPGAAGGVEISTTFTDNILAPNPVFAPRRVIAADLPDGQGASIRFAGNGSPNAYIAWVRFTDFYFRRLGFARSTDNGNTWSAPREITSDFIGMDEVLGNDRVNENPSLAVDRSGGPYTGYLYVVYSNNNSLDGADVYFKRSLDGGVTFSAPVAINSRPGGDRPQWFPFVTVDKNTGRVTVFYYDQGVDTNGDLTEVTYLYSDDGGTTWSAPAALSDRPFKAGWGNDTNEPNLGDYNQAVAQLGNFYAAYAATRPQRFTDGQPSTQLLTPDVFFSKVNQGTLKLPLRLGAVTFADSGADGSLDAGETARFRLAVTNRDTNPLHARTVSAVTAVLSSSTAGVTVVQPSSAYPNILPGATAQNTTEFALSLAPNFIPGTPIELKLAVTANGGTAVLNYTQPTGTLLTTTLLVERFDSAAPGTLPAGWRSLHGAGGNTVPWVANNTFCGASGKAFHPNANDGLAEDDNSRWERLASPSISIPGDAQSVEVEFDVCYNTEEDPNLRYLAYDGFFLRVTDVTPGRTLRSVLAEAFEEEFTTDGIKHYPRHLAENDDPDYFPDMSAWAGNSGGIRHVRMKLPGIAGSTVQFRFEYAQDASGTCADLRPGSTCGVAVDNFVVRSLRAVARPTVNLIWQPRLTRDAAGINAFITVTNNGTAAAQNVILTSAVLGSTNALNLPPFGTIQPGASATVAVNFPVTDPAGTGSFLRIAGSYTGGTFGGSVRVTLP